MGAPLDFAVLFGGDALGFASFHSTVRAAARAAEDQGFRALWLVPGGPQVGQSGMDIGILHATVAAETQHIALRVAGINEELARSDDWAVLRSLLGRRLEFAVGPTAAPEIPLGERVWREVQGIADGERLPNDLPIFLRLLPAKFDDVLHRAQTLGRAVGTDRTNPVSVVVPMAALRGGGGERRDEIVARGVSLCQLMAAAGVSEVTWALDGRLLEESLDSIACLADVRLALATDPPNVDAPPSEFAWLDAAKTRCTEEISGSEWVERQEADGHRVCDSAGSIEQIWRRDGEALATLAVAPSSRGALLDAAIEVLCAALPREALERPLAVAGFEQLAWTGAQTGTSAVVHAYAEHCDTLASPCGKLAIFGEGGLLVARARRVHFLPRSERTHTSPSYEINWEASELSAKPPLPGAWLVVCDRLGIAGELAGLLSAAGHSVSLVRSSAELSASLLAPSAPVRAVVHLGSVVDADADLPERLAAIDDLLAAARAVITPTSAVRGTRLWVITRGVQPVGPAPTLDPVSGAAWGLGRVLATEHPKSFGGMVDLDAATDVRKAAADLLRVLFRAPVGEQVAVRGERDFVARLDRSSESPLPTSPCVCRPDRTYLITGGFGSIGLTLADWLSKAGARHILLIGRKPPGPTDGDGRARRTLATIRKRGVHVYECAADVTDREAMSDALTPKGNPYPPVAGVIHAAAVWNDQPLLNLDAPTLRAVLAPKVLGALLLDSLLADRQLDFFVLVSSIASLLGSPSQANYAAGNAFLDAFASYKRSRGVAALSINWGPWAGTEAGRRASASTRGVRVLCTPAAHDSLNRALAGGKAQCGPAEIDWGALADALPVASRLPIFQRLVQARSDGALRRHIAGLPPGSRAAALEQEIRTDAARVLRMRPEDLSPTTPLLAVGLDSMMALEFRRLLETRLEATVSLGEVLSGACVRDLARRLADEMLQESTEGPVQIPRRAGPAAPLSFAQERIWFAESIRPGTSAYTIVAAFSALGELDVGALERAFKRLVTRHESLRTTFSLDDGVPFQVVHADADLELNHRAVDANEVDNAIHADCHRPFDLAKGPLLRVSVFRTSAARHVVLITMHHVVSDGWSMGVLAREVMTAYRDEVSGEGSPAPETQIQFADYAAWERESANDQRLSAPLEYWAETLAGAVESLDLPRDGSDDEDSAGSCEFLIEGDFAETLRRVAQSEGGTLFSLWMSAWMLLLSRHSGQHDIVVGTPFAMRSQIETAGMIGCLINTLPVRADLSDDPPFSALLRQVSRTAASALQHGDVPFERMVRRLGLKPTLGKNPLFETLLNFVNIGLPSIQLAGLDIVPLAVPPTDARFLLTLYVHELPAGFRIQCVYRASAFARERIEHWLCQYECLLRQIADRPTLRIGELSLVPEAASGIPDPRVTLPVPDQPKLATRLQEVAARWPEAIAIRQHGRGWTYQELAIAARTITEGLRSAGLEQGDVVAVSGARSFGLLAALWGVLASEAVLLTLDDNYPKARRAKMLDAAACRWTLRVQPREQSGSEAGVVTVDPSTGRWVHETTTPARAARRHDVDAAYIFFTSGTTGEPKGVIGSHRGLSHFLGWQRTAFQVGPRDRVAQLTSLSFDVVLRDVFLVLTAGGTLCLPPSVGFELAGHRVLSWMRDEEITLLHAVPSLAEAWLADAPEFVGPSVRYTFFAGEPLTDVLVQRWRRAFPATKVANLYGPTETTLAKFCHLVEDPLVPGVQPVGAPLPETQGLVLRGQAHRCGVGELGEVVIRTPFRSRGYLDEDSEHRFYISPFGQTSDDVLYRTGDRGRYRLDGTLDLLGRTDHQLKIRGVRVEPAEIAAVLRDYSDVASAVVVGRRGATGDTTLVAYLVPDRGASFDRAGLRSFLEKRLPDAMIPTRFVELSRLPLTPNGKLDRAALPPPDDGEETRAFRHPEGTLEKQIAGIWRSLLNVEAVGADDDFFQLGGHSLLAARLAGRLSRTYSVDVPLKMIFEARTLSSLAAAVETAVQLNRPAQPPTALPRIRTTLDGPNGNPRHGYLFPAAPAQRLMWINAQVDPAADFYNVSLRANLSGPLEPDRIRRALADVVRRHETLRTTFTVKDGSLVQFIAVDIELPVIIADVGGDDAVARINQARQELGRVQFDLEAGPLWRCIVLRAAANEHVFLFSGHHTIVDGWSAAVFVRDFATSYDCHLSDGGRTARPVVQYADVSARQAKTLESELPALLAYWRETLAGAPARVALPYDCSGSVGGGLAPAGSCSSQILPTTARRLEQLARTKGATLFTLLLTALVSVLRRWTQQEDLVVGTVVANREGEEAEGLIGNFVNFVPLRLRIPGNSSLGDVLALASRVVSGAFGHQACPFDLLVEAARAPSMGSGGIYNVSLVHHTQPAPDQRLSETLTGSFEPLLSRRTTPGDLRLVASSRQGTTELALEFDARRFEKRTAESLLASISAAICALTESLSTPLEELQVPPIRQAGPTGKSYKLVIAATFTAEPIAEPFSFWAREAGIDAVLEFAPFNQVLQQLLDQGSVLSRNRDANVLLVRFDDWARPGGEEHDVLGAAEWLSGAIRAAAERSGAAFVVALCPPKPDAGADATRAAAICAAQAHVSRALSGARQIELLLPDDILGAYAVEDFSEPDAEAVGGIPYSPEFFVALAAAVVRRLHRSWGAPYKVLVVDADGTLWKGVAGEDGASGVTFPADQLALQRVLVEQQAAGRLVCVVSKNEPDDVRAVFRQREREMPLSAQHVVAWKVNWRRKSENLKELASELRLGLDSFVVFDDNPVECAEMRAHCPEALVVQVPEEPGSLARILQHLWALDTGFTSGEDQHRTQLYRDELEREALRRHAPTFTDFLEELGTVCTVRDLRPGDAARISQLTQRTNQFNCSGRRRTEAEVAASVNDGSLRWLVVDVKDRLGDYGTVGVFALVQTGRALIVETFLLSCRALGRGVEYRMIAEVAALGRSLGADTLQIQFFRTAKNTPAQQFLSKIATRHTPDGELTADGETYVLPIAAAEGVRFAPGEPDHEVSSEPAETATLPIVASGRSDRLLRIALELQHPAVVLERLAALRQRPRPNIAERYVEPRNALERLLARIWGDVLGTDRIGVHDDFFLLGGQSLLAAMTAARIRRAVAANVTLPLLFARPTIATLAKELVVTAGAGILMRAEALEEVLALSDAQADELLRLDSHAADGGG